MNLNLLNNSASKWASQNIIAARFLLILSEILRLSIAFYLGKTIIAPITGNEYLLLCILLLSLVYVLIRKNTKRRHYKSFYKNGLLIMSCSWALYFFTGSLFSSLDSNRNSHGILANDVQLSPKSGLLAETMKKNKVQIKIREKEKKKMSFSTKRKILYGFLFLLSLPLTFFGLVMACSLGCSGYVFWPWVFYILSLGVLAAGIFFLRKLISKKNPRKYKNLNKHEKWKAWKPFFVSWILVLGAVAIFLLFAN